MMLSEQFSQNLPRGKITEGVEENVSIQELIEFISLCLSLFANKNKGATDSNENRLTRNLCILLNRKGFKLPFFFHPEEMENSEKGNSPRIDIGTFSQSEKIYVNERIYGENDSFFKIEAKRLCN